MTSLSLRPVSISLDKFPNEIIHSIAASLAPHHLRKLAQVSRIFAAFVRDHHVWIKLLKKNFFCTIKQPEEAKRYYQILSDIQKGRFFLKQIENDPDEDKTRGFVGKAFDYFQDPRRPLYLYDSSDVVKIEKTPKSFSAQSFRALWTGTHFISSNRYDMNQLVFSKITNNQLITCQQITLPEEALITSLHWQNGEFIYLTSQLDDQDHYCVTLHFMSLDPESKEWIERWSFLVDIPFFEKLYLDNEKSIKIVNLPFLAWDGKWLAIILPSPFIPECMVWAYNFEKGRNDASQIKPKSLHIDASLITGVQWHGENLWIGDTRGLVKIWNRSTNVTQVIDCSFPLSATQPNLPTDYYYSYDFIPFEQFMILATHSMVGTIVTSWQWNKEGYVKAQELFRSNTPLEVTKKDENSLLLLEPNNGDLYTLTFGVEYSLIFHCLSYEYQGKKPEGKFPSYSIQMHPSQLFLRMPLSQKHKIYEEFKKITKADLEYDHFISQLEGINKNASLAAAIRNSTQKSADTTASRASKRLRPTLPSTD